MKKKKYLICFGLWTCFIWFNSLLPGDASGELSGSLSYQIYEILHLSMPFDFFHTLIRKCAHFSEYTVLGIFSVLALKNKHVLYAGFMGVFVACADELIQLFVRGRSGQVSDVLIDSLGVCFGIVLVCLFQKKKKC